MDEANKKLKNAIGALKNKADAAQTAATEAKSLQEMYENDYKNSGNQYTENKKILGGKDKSDYSSEISKTDKLIEMSAKNDIPQVACRMASRSPDFARWTSVFRPKRRLRSRKLLEQGGSAREAAESWPRGGVFQRSGQTCPAAFVQFERGSRSCA